MADRRAQPYRKGSQGRNPGMALQNMTRGRTMGGFNPQDGVRRAQLLMRAGKQTEARGPRPARPARPAR
jgi:hypothetical protein